MTTGDKEHDSTKSPTPGQAKPDKPEPSGVPKAEPGKANGETTAPGAGPASDPLVGVAPRAEPASGVKQPRRVGAETIQMPEMGRLTPPPDLADEKLNVKELRRRWLESRTKEELIELIFILERKEPELDITSKMIVAHTRTSEKIVAVTPGALPDDMVFVKLPTVRRGDLAKESAAWRIALISVDVTYKPLGLEIDSEITVGRASGGALPDLDLIPYGGTSKGASRLHAKLRPSETSLTLVDCASTNGTFCNTSRLDRDGSVALKDGDVIGFGRVIFIVKIVKSPEMPNL